MGGAPHPHDIDLRPAGEDIADGFGLVCRVQLVLRDVAERRFPLGRKSGDIAGVGPYRVLEEGPAAGGPDDDRGEPHVGVFEFPDLSAFFEGDLATTAYSPIPTHGGVRCTEMLDR